MRLELKQAAKVKLGEYVATSTNEWGRVTRAHSRGGWTDLDVEVAKGFPPRLLYSNDAMLAVMEAE